MQCPQCNNQVFNNTSVCTNCGAEIGVCVKCNKFSYFIDIDFSQIVEWICASILLGILFNYSKVRFRKCATCKNSVQVCINCGGIFKGMNKCPHCQYSHFVGSYSIITYLKSKMREQWGTLLIWWEKRLSSASEKVRSPFPTKGLKEIKEISNFEGRPFKEN